MLLFQLSPSLELRTFTTITTASPIQRYSLRLHSCNLNGRPLCGCCSRVLSVDFWVSAREAVPCSWKHDLSQRNGSYLPARAKSSPSAVAQCRSFKRQSTTEHLQLVCRSYEPPWRWTLSRDLEEALADMVFQECER